LTIEGLELSGTKTRAAESFSGTHPAMLRERLIDYASAFTTFGKRREREREREREKEKNFWLEILLYSAAIALI